jgi:predicted nucleotidyltransferase
LKVSTQRDVIEVPISGELDINGWELRKALGLLKKGNATLIEWLDSPVVYRADGIFCSTMRDAARQPTKPNARSTITCTWRARTIASTCAAILCG